MDDIKKNFDSIQNDTVPKLAADGKTYIISNANCFYMPMYRPSVLAKAGWNTFPQTYDELLKCCADLKKNGVTPIALMTNPGNYGEQTIDIMIWSIMQGNNIVVDGKPAFNTDAVKGAYTCIKQMYDLGYIVKDVDKGTYRGMLGTGEVGILVDGPWVYGIMADTNPNIGNDVAIANTSFFPAHKFSAGWEGFAVSSKTANPQVACDYVSYLTSKKEMTNFTKIVGIVTDRTDVFDAQTTQEVLKLYPWFQGFIDGAPNAISNSAVGFPADRIEELRKIASAALEAVLYEGTDVDTALAKAQADSTAGRRAASTIAPRVHRVPPRVPCSRAMPLRCSEGVNGRLHSVNGGSTTARRAVYPCRARGATVGPGTRPQERNACSTGSLVRSRSRGRMARCRSGVASSEPCSSTSPSTRTASSPRSSSSRTSGETSRRPRPYTRCRCTSRASARSYGTGRMAARSWSRSPPATCSRSDRATRSTSTGSRSSTTRADE
jgi:maltose-binding protein MalE